MCVKWKMHKTFYGKFVKSATSIQKETPQPKNNNLKYTLKYETKIYIFTLSLWKSSPQHVIKQRIIYKYKKKKKTIQILISNLCQQRPAKVSVIFALFLDPPLDFFLHYLNENERNNNKNIIKIWFIRESLDTCDAKAGANKILLFLFEQSARKIHIVRHIV